MHLSEISVYPIKSLGGILMEDALIQERGLQFDRRWMLIDENNEFLTQREFPRMALLETKTQNENLLVYESERQKSIELRPANKEPISVKIWSSRVKADVYPSEVNNWFSEFLQTKCRLVLMPPESKRKVSPFYAVRKFIDTVSFADAYPFLLIGQSSLDDLNARLSEPLPMNRFRPNLVVAGAAAFAEDNWKKIKIGATIFHLVKPCARCVITTIDQKRGEKNGKEPLKTLAQYRTRRGKVLFGQNLIAENFGETVKVGDLVEILEEKS